MNAEDADTAQMKLATARNLSTSTETLLDAAEHVAEARERLDDPSILSILQRVREADNPTRKRELLREAEQLLEPHTSDNLEVRA